MGKPPKTIDDLAGDPANPREISAEAATGLSESLSEFGDLSGITFNIRTGQLVCGHQRVEQLRAKGAYLDVENNRLVVEADGVEFPIRLVDWSLSKQRAANVVANSTAISGTFTADVDLLLDDVRTESPELYESLLLDELRVAVPVPDFPPAGADEQGRLDQKAKKECPKCGHKFL